MKLHMQILIALGLGLKRNGHIFFGLIAGIIVGIILHHQLQLAPNSPLLSTIIAVLDFVGQGFIRLIQMVVIPLVFSAIIVGISSIGDNKQLGKFGSKMILYYAIISILAVLIGLGLSLLLQPGQGVQSLISAQTSIEIQNTVQQELVRQSGNLSQLFLNLIPNNPLSALAVGDMIPIILFVLIFAIAFAKVGEIARPLVSIFESIFAATMKVTDWIMYLAAPGVFKKVRGCNSLY